MEILRKSVEKLGESRSWAENGRAVVCAMQYESSTRPAGSMFDDEAAREMTTVPESVPETSRRSSRSAFGRALPLSALPASRPRP